MAALNVTQPTSNALKSQGNPVKRVNSLVKEDGPRRRSCEEIHRGGPARRSTEEVHKGGPKMEVLKTDREVFEDKRS